VTLAHAEPILGVLREMGRMVGGPKGGRRGETPHDRGPGIRGLMQSPA
jgi:hypothetical protein